MSKSDFFSKLLRPLEVDDHDGLEGQSFSVANVGPIAPLLYRLDGGGRQGGIALHQSHAANLARLIHDLFEDYRCFCSCHVRCGGVGWRNAVASRFSAPLEEE